ncbi:carnitine O-palmitoyltransferase 2, mitochondrial [Microplitis mediator]|uniref:carnitine O-palmitoyltransferase 2, mitochondrial n=1 Tax=Microplitis mediator TaxID=375433 RepID=UPI0025546311|nr:carnitine O-palmitoyltransferase 2, mitochondrial [Microplitis mediator]
MILLRNPQYLNHIKTNGTAKRLPVIYSISNRTRVTNEADEHEYIQRSKLPTMHFQKSLPRLPIPKLENSCRRYLKAQQPILTPKEFKETSRCVLKFLSEEGPPLQKLLLEDDKYNKHTSYISGYWFDMYLRDRKPLPVNYNPLLVFVQEKDVRYNKPLVKATNLLVSSARFMKSLRAGILEPEVYHVDPKKSDTDLFRTVTGLMPSNFATYAAYFFGAYPLDMSQFPYLFGTTRIPKPTKDTLTHDLTSEHVIIMRKGHFYMMNIIDHRGKVCSPLDIASCLKYILNDERPPNDCPVGVLTAANRDHWAKVRGHLIALGNENVLHKIDSAAFVFALDDDDHVEADYHKLLRLFLHSDGTNRWFDKSFSLIMSGDGVAGINFEHSWGDGVAVLRYFKDLKHDIEKNPRFHPEDEASVPGIPASVKKLDFKIDDKIREIVRCDFNEYKSWTQDKLTIDYLIFEEFGKEECKKFKVSPDAVMQLAFQLALYKNEKRAVPTYESCSTSAFKHGRTETVRSCTNETKALCAAIVDRGVSTANDDELKKLMIECSKAHTNLVKEAAMGQGFDRHLFALKKIVEDSENIRMPHLFKDPAYQKINHNILSTSTLSSPEVMAGGFGPVVEDGYGIGYMIQDHKLGSVVTGYRGHRESSDYIKYLKSAFEDIHRILKSK